MPTVSSRPHHDGSALYVSNATPALGETVWVRVRVPAGYGPITRVLVRSNPDHEVSWSEATRERTDQGWDWWCAPIVVANPRHGYRFHLQHEDGHVEILHQGGRTDLESLDTVDFALVAGNPPPSWMPEAVMYQVFPDRFARSRAAEDRAVPEWAIPAAWDDPVAALPPGRGTQMFGGDLDGIIEKLDHLVSLGVTVLYHTPIFPARSNHRYDASSFDTVDPLLGGDEAYARLIAAAHERGIRVIGDLTTNHSGSAHEWFTAAFGHPGAPEEEFYFFRDAENTQYETWLDAISLPKFNWRSEELRRRFIQGPDSVVAKWLRPPYGIDGWRIDVANMTGRLGAEDLNAQVRQTVRQTMVDISPDTLLIAESTNDAASDLQGDAWHGAMTYPAFTRGVWAWLADPLPVPSVREDGSISTEPWFFGVPTGMPRYGADQFVAQYERFTSQIPWRVQTGTMLALNTHDTARFALYASPGSIPLAVGLSLTLPGIPVIYAGDEFGLGGTSGEASRIPVPWARAEEPEVAERIALYRDLIALRHAHPALSVGGLRWLYADHSAVVFAREHSEETVLIVAARGELEVTMDAAVLPGIHRAHRVFGDGALEAEGEGPVTLRAHGPSFTVWTLPGVTAPAWDTSGA